MKSKDGLKDALKHGGDGDDRTNGTGSNGQATKYHNQSINCYCIAAVLIYRVMVWLSGEALSLSL